MSDQLVTVATYWNTDEANIARSQLEAAGIRAFLAGAETVDMVWVLANTVQGVRLQVAEHDAERAADVLTEENDVIERMSTIAAEDDLPEAALTQREQDADRALRIAILGLLFAPLNLYGLWILWKVYLSDEPLRPQKRRNAIIAAVLGFPGLLLGFFEASLLLALPFMD